MIGDTREELEARLGTLEHIKAFVDMLVKCRKAELSELRKRKKEESLACQRKVVK